VKPIDNIVSIGTIFPNIGIISPIFSESMVLVKILPIDTMLKINGVTVNYSSIYADISSGGLLSGMWHIDCSNLGQGWCASGTFHFTGNNRSWRSQVNRNRTKETLVKWRKALSKKADRILRALAAAMVA
jgi:hypothetical protein